VGSMRTNPLGVMRLKSPPDSTRRCWGPLEEAHLLTSKYAHLVLVTDGSSLDLPFAALVDGEGKRLIERYALSSSIFAGALRGSAPLRSAKPRSSMSPIPLSPPGQRRLCRAAMDRRVPMVHCRILVARFHAPASLKGVHVREAKVKQELGKYTFLHFGALCHLDNKDGLRSYLRLAPEPPDSEEDGHLERGRSRRCSCRLNWRCSRLARRAKGFRAGAKGCGVWPGPFVRRVAAAWWLPSGMSKRRQPVGLLDQFYANLLAGSVRMRLAACDVGGAVSTEQGGSGSSVSVLLGFRFRWSEIPPSCRWRLK